MSAGTGGSIPQPADIRLTWFPASPFGVCLGQPAAQDAMLNCDTIEWEYRVMTVMMCHAAAAAWSIPGQSHQLLHELLRVVLAEIMKKGLTTMLLPCAFRTGHLYDRT